ncbi:hypothetical protein JG687_00009526 [Phytophthora cactorum]|uniref:START-like domain n=1 Tax=Phytophthora cactorum TaxID=29920 RepID=A0A8T1U9H0_9STRA|nr:hypothetical protein JG687_00009526 [Phytophthora cactorum]
MKFTLPDDVFPPVRLSRKHQGALIEEAETVVSETIAANEVFLAQGAQFHDSKWRLVRVKEGLHVYRQRRPHRARAGIRKRLGTDTEEETQVSPSSVNDCSIQDSMRRPSVSLMVLHGTVDGTLDDSMFGAFAATDDAWKWRSSHVNDRLDDARILATIRGPTRSDPFRFLGIKWFAKEHPTILTGILQRRDFLIMEATGLTTDSKGEKIGYFLMHSVTLRGVPKLSELGILRGELSFCFILRQSGPGKVELYCRGFSDPHGEMMERVSVAIASEALICSAGVVDYAYIKKLTWLMKHKNQAWMWRSSHLNDRLDDARILATIRGPTRNDPFRFLGIKWFAKENPAVLSGIVQQRDFLVMEATGLTHDSKGDTVGFYLMHSVSLPGVPELSDMGIIRGQVSLCYIDRQSGPGKVEMFCRGFSDPRGGMLDRVSVGIASEALICAAGVVDYAYIKKLTWLMKHKGGRKVDPPRPTRCETCDKSFTKFSFTGAGVGAPCQICSLVVCGKCSVVKKMTVDVSSAGSVKQCALRFCLTCLLEAKEKSVWEMALSGVETSSECSSTSGSARAAYHL